MDKVAFDILLVFSVIFISTLLKTVKTKLLANNVSPLMISIIDSVFGYATMAIVATNIGVEYLLAFVISKTIGTVLGDKISGKFMNSFHEVIVYAPKEKAIRIADEVRLHGYSVTTHIGYGNDGNKRFAINVFISAKELNVLREILSNHGYKDATMIIKDVKNYSGKINTKV